MEEPTGSAPLAPHDVALPLNDASAIAPTSDAGDASAALAHGLTFTLTVGQAREVFAEHRRKVPAERTLQNYCAEGIITGQKIRTTDGSEWLINEPSLLEFIDRQPTITPAAAPHAPHDLAVPLSNAPATPAPSDAGDASAAHAALVGERRSLADVLIENAKLLAQTEGKDQMIVELKEDRHFLREELREARKGRDDVKSIANRMLETLETMALGGRLLRPTERPQEPRPTQHEDITDQRG